MSLIDWLLILFFGVLKKVLFVIMRGSIILIVWKMFILKRVVWCLKFVVSFFLMFVIILIVIGGRNSGELLNIFLFFCI